jgi:hypothetical protein
LSGAPANIIQSETAEEAIGFAMAFMIFIPSLIGTALGFAAIDRRLSNPFSVWIAAIWNGIILGIYVLLCIIGLFVG